MKKKFPKSDPGNPADGSTSATHLSSSKSCKKDPLRTIKLFMSRQVMTLGEACGRVVELMIKVDIPDLPEFDKAYTPLQWTAGRLGKSPQTVIKWTYDWTSSSGKPPTIKDLLALTHLSKSERPAELLYYLVGNQSLDELTNQYGSVLKMVGTHIGKLSENLNRMARDYSHKNISK